MNMNIFEYENIWEYIAMNMNIFVNIHVNICEYL